MDNFLENWDKYATIVFAGLSAIFAGLSFLVIYLDYKRNNPRVEVKMTRAFANLPQGLIDCVNCSVLNKGRRPVKIRRFYFLLKDGQTLVFFPNNHSDFLMGYPEFPTTLDETEIMEFTIYLSSLKEAIKDLPASVSSLCFQDTADKIYKYNLRKKHWSDLIK